MKRWLITGGAGFIGSALVRYLLRHTADHVLVVDKLTYAGNLASLAPVVNEAGFQFEQQDIVDAPAIRRIIDQYQPDYLLHLAAESHVDRSIDTPGTFIHTNLLGTYTLLEAARHYWQKLDKPRQRAFRFHHISTDEVFGDLAPGDALFNEQTPYAPSSPYSASKAGSDHLVCAWHRTYGLPVLLTNCSNNYGPYHFPEKMIPLMILNALAGKPLPVYGDGQQVRDWLYVDDHAAALWQVASQAQAGSHYAIGGHNEHTNLQVVEHLCQLLEELAPHKPAGVAHYADLIRFVTDRPGHDRRYAIDAGKIARELGWQPQETFHSGLRKTVQWYLHNEAWWRPVQEGSHQRLGLAGLKQAVP